MCNLSECHEPLFRLIESLEREGSGRPSSFLVVALDINWPGNPTVGEESK